MYFSYILKSLKDQKYYIGSCGDIEERLARHNSGREKSTKHRLPFKLVYKEVYNTRAEAIQREKQLKSYKGGEAFKKLISQFSEQAGE